MANSVVRVLLTAKDEVTGVLRGISKSLSGWSHDVTKIAAGIGLADSFKELGRFIRDSVAEAANAYPHLSAGFRKVGEDFKEFRIQAGAAFLDVLKPAVPLLEQSVKWATELAKQLPNAFDGAKIALIELIGWIQKLPSFARQGFGGMAAAIGTTFGNTGLAAAGVAQTAGANARIAQIDAETAAKVAAAAAAVHDFGPRALTDEQKKAIEDRRRAFVERGVAASDLSIREQGGPGVIGRPAIGTRSSGLGGVDAGALPTGEAFQGMSEGAADFGNSLRDALGTLGDFNQEAENTNQVLSRMAADVVVNLVDSFGNLAEQIGAGRASLGDFGKAAVKAIAGAAISEGKIGIAKGFAKIAEGAFPPNPPLIASGALMVAKNTALIALASALSGGGGGAGGSGSSGVGSLSSGGAQGSLGDAARQRDRNRLTVILPPVQNNHDPAIQDWLAEIMRNGADRDVVFQVGGVN